MTHTIRKPLALDRFRVWRERLPYYSGSKPSGGIRFLASEMAFLVPWRVLQRGSFVGVQTILVVADEPVTRNLIVHVLTTRGFRVYEADSEVEADTLCEALGPSAFDLVIADHVLIGTTGRALAERVASFCPGVKIVQLSDLSYHDMSARDELVADGAFLQRPFTPQQLLDAVDNALAPRTQ